MAPTEEACMHGYAGAQGQCVIAAAEDNQTLTSGFSCGRSEDALLSS
jgi:hypothetical protein